MDSNAPTSLSAISSYGSIDLSWTAPTIGDPAPTYEIRRGTASGSYSTIASGVAGTAYSDTTATNEVTYFYVVRATNAAGTSANSNEVTGRSSTTPRFALDFTRESIQPMIGNQAMTFTRADTTIAGTHHGPDGRLRLAPHNFALRSEEFQTIWQFQNASVSANSTTAPDGNATADRLVENTANGYHETYQQVGKLAESLPCAATVYAKAGTRSVLAMSLSDAGGSNYAQAGFDLATGKLLGSIAVGTGFTVIEAGIEAVGDGWYRLSLSAMTDASASLVMWLSLGSNPTTLVYTGDGNGYVSLWGAQLEINRNPSFYLPTTTAARYDGPRFDYHPITKAARGIRFDESRTNLFRYSDQMENADWTQIGTTIAVNTTATADPMGSNRAERAIETAATSDHIVHGWFGKPATTGHYSLSVYAKKDQRDRLALMMHGTSSADRYGAEFDLTTGVASEADPAQGGYANGSYRIENVGNGWYRCSISAELSTDTNVYTHFALLDATGTAGASTYAGNTSNGLYLYGGQAELTNGAPGFASSYIPSVGSATTRNHEYIQSSSLGAWYTSTKGTWFLDFEMADHQVAFNSGVALSLYADSNNYYRVNTQPGNYIVVDQNTAGAGTNSFNFWRQWSEGGIAGVKPYRTAFTINPGDTVARMNGATGLEGGGYTLDLALTLPIPTSMRIGHGGTNTFEPFNGWIKEIRFYGDRLTDGDLATITTVDPITFADDFNDGSLNPGWLAGVGSGHCETCDLGTGATVAETSGQLQTTGHHLTDTGIDGYVTAQTYDMRGAMVEVELIQPISSVGNAANTVQSALSIFPNGVDMTINFATYDNQNDSLNFYGEIQNGVTWLDFGLGIYGGMGPAYDPTAHRFLRIRHDLATNYLYMETSPNRHTWTTIYYGAWSASSLADVRFGITGGKFGTGTATRIRGMAFDNFRTTAIPNP